MTLFTSVDMLQFSEAPLDVLGLWKYVQKVPRVSSTQASGEMPFEVGRHPDAQSKVARDMIDRVAADVAEYAQLHNNSLIAECSFLRQAEEIMSNDAMRETAREGVAALLAALTAQREADARYVQKALPQLLKQVHSVPPPQPSTLRVARPPSSNAAKTNVVPSASMTTPRCSRRGASTSSARTAWANTCERPRCPSNGADLPAGGRGREPTAET